MFNLENEFFYIIIIEIVAKRFQFLTFHCFLRSIAFPSGVVS